MTLKSGETASSAAELQKRQSNPSKFAGACSGHTFLNTLCDDADLFQAFVSCCQSCFIFVVHSSMHQNTGQRAVTLGKRLQRYLSSLQIMHSIICIVNYCTSLATSRFHCAEKDAQTSDPVRKPSIFYGPVCGCPPVHQNSTLLLMVCLATDANV